MYLMLLMHFLENKVAVELTQSEFVEAQEVGDLSFFFFIMPVWSGGPCLCCRANHL